MKPLMGRRYVGIVSSSLRRAKREGLAEAQGSLNPAMPNEAAFNSQDRLPERLNEWQDSMTKP